MTTMEPTATEVRMERGDQSHATHGTQAAPREGQAVSLHPVEPSPQTARQSPDPMQGTDRYRLVTPFTLRL